MVMKSVRFVDAVIRVNGLVDFYAKEKARLEDNLAKVLLPSGLTFVAASVKDALDPKYIGAAVFLGFFFLTYAMVIYLDLFSAERTYVAAFKLQSALYKYADADGAKPLMEVADAQTLEAYDLAEAQVGKQRYSMPTSKPLFAMAGGVGALILYLLMK